MRSKRLQADGLAFGKRRRRSNWRIREPE